MTTISPFLWFGDGRAEEAAQFYTGLFGESAITGVTPYPEGPHGRAGEVMTVDFELAGNRFTALNGGDQFQFTPAISFVIECADQDEVDHFWDGLLEGGQAMQCGWLSDRFGVTWQVVPRVLFELLADPDPAVVQRASDAMMPMVKLDGPALVRAARS